MAGTSWEVLAGVTDAHAYIYIPSLLLIKSSTQKFILINSIAVIRRKKDCLEKNYLLKNLHFTNTHTRIIAILRHIIIIIMDDVPDKIPIKKIYKLLFDGKWKMSFVFIYSILVDWWLRYYVCAIQCVQSIVLFLVAHFCVHG